MEKARLQRAAIVAACFIVLGGCSQENLRTFAEGMDKQFPSNNGSTYVPPYALQKTDSSAYCPNGTWPRSQYSGPGGGLYTGPGGGAYTGPGGGAYTGPGGGAYTGPGGGMYTGPGGGMYTGPGGGMYSGPGGGMYTGPGGGMYTGPGSYCTNRPSLRELKRMGEY